MFHDTTDKALKTTRTFNDRDVFPVVPASTLLRSPHRVQVLKEIRALSEVPDDTYDDLYKKLIVDFVEFVQLLPVNNEARLGSLLDEGLWRGMYVLQLQQHSKEEDQEIEPVMDYVVFSAALMFDIGCVIEDRTVVISDRDGGFVRYWFPYNGPMGGDDGYYKIRRGGGVPPWVSKKTVTLLARQIMPEVGFNWIAEDPYALNVWLALLNNDRDSAGAFGLNFDKVIELLRTFRTSQDFFMMPFEVDVTESEANALGEDFLEWLRKNLEEKKLTVNQKDSVIFLTKKGMFIDQVVFKRFADSIKNRIVSWANVYAQVRNLGFVHDELKKYAYAAMVRHGSPFGGFRRVAHGTGAAPAGAKPALFAAGKKAVGFVAAKVGAIAKVAAKPGALAKPGAAKPAAKPAGGMFKPSAPPKAPMPIGQSGWKEGVLIASEARLQGLVLPYTAAVQNTFQVIGVVPNATMQFIAANEAGQLQQAPEEALPKAYDFSKSVVAPPVK